MDRSEAPGRSKPPESSNAAIGVEEVSGQDSSTGDLLGGLLMSSMLAARHCTKEQEMLDIARRFR